MFSRVHAGVGEFQYLYVTVWDDGVPRVEFEGGWQKVYAEMQRKYSDRGYLVEGRAE